MGETDVCSRVSVASSCQTLSRLQRARFGGRRRRCPVRKSSWPRPLHSAQSSCTAFHPSQANTDNARLRSEARRWKREGERSRSHVRSVRGSAATLHWQNTLHSAQRLRVSTRIHGDSGTSPSRQRSLRRMERCRSCVESMADHKTPLCVK